MCLIGRDAGKLETVAKEIGSAARCYATDIGNDGAVRELVAAVQRDVKRLDILVHSAGVISLGALSSGPVSGLDAQFRINTRAPFLLTQAFLPALRASRGQVVFMNSNAALRPGVDNGLYAATKSALRIVADSFREEVNVDGIRVLTLFVGRTATPMQARVCQQQGKDYRPGLLIQPEDIASIVISALALPRTVEITEIALRPASKA